MSLPQPDGPGLIDSRWEDRWDAAVAWAPYITLVISLMLSLTISDHGWEDRLLTLGLSVVAAGWVMVMFTRAVDRRSSQPWTRVYYAGLVVLGTILILHDFYFFVFVITGFFHAYLLSPTALVFVGVGATSLVINGSIFLGNPGVETLAIGLVVMVIQTAVIGLGIVGSEKLAALSEQRRRTVLELESALAENAALQSQLLSQAREAGVSEERQRIAREIHDTIAQGLIGIITQLEAGARAVHNPDEARQRMDNASRLAREGLEEARRSVNALMPRELEQRGLSEALGDAVDRWTELNRIPAELSVTGDVQGMHPEVEVTLLRVAQEALANVAKHASASHVRVTLSYMEDVVNLDVKDDGRGFDPASSGGFGLTTMRQRVGDLRGDLTVETGNGHGTALSATVPIPTFAEP